MPRPRRRDPRGGDFINGPTPRETDVITMPTRYAVHSYAKLGAARSWVFTTAHQLTPWDAYFGFNSTLAASHTRYSNITDVSAPHQSTVPHWRLRRGTSHLPDPSARDGPVSLTNEGRPEPAAADTSWPCAVLSITDIPPCVSPGGSDGHQWLSVQSCRGLAKPAEGWPGPAEGWPGPAEGWPGPAGGGQTLPGVGQAHRTVEGRAMELESPPPPPQRSREPQS